MRTWARARHLFTFVISASALAACATYGPADVAAMSTYDICSIQLNQGSALADSSRHLLQSELDRRKESCQPHRAAIQAERDARLYDLTYGQQSP